MNGDEVLAALETRLRTPRSISPDVSHLARSHETLQKNTETRMVRLIPASSIPPVEATFVFPPYIPRGEVTWVEGTTKSGKTMCAIDIIARGTRLDVHPLTGEPIAGARAAILTCEDAPGTTIVPRLIAAGADLNRVSIVRVEDAESGVECVPSFLRDLDGLAERIRDEHADILLVDGTFGILGAVNGNDYAEAYRVMLPVVNMIRNLRIGALMLRHTRKSEASAMQRGIGSVGYASLGRSTVSVAVDRDDETGKRRVWAHAGSNTIESGPSLGFIIEGTELAGFARTVGRVRWTEILEGVSADDLDRSRALEDSADKAVADDWLETFLIKPTPAEQVFAAADRTHIARRTLQRAAKRLGVVIERRGFGEGSLWSPPIRDTENHSRHSRLGSMGGANGEFGANGVEL